MNNRSKPDLLLLDAIERRLRAVPRHCIRCDVLSTDTGTTYCADGQRHVWQLVDYPALAREVARMLEEQREVDAKIAAKTPGMMFHVQHNQEEVDRICCNCPSQIATAIRSRR